MNNRRAAFVISAADAAGCPHPRVPEYAFFGRSNVGKSSLINMITGVKNLAKTSSTPGKTQLLNYFTVDEDTWYLVDLPGYGYAKVSKKARRDWEKIIREYLTIRKSLVYTFILVDTRHKPQNSDLELINWMGEQGLPFCLIFTKADKISRNAVKRNVEEYKNVLAQKWEELPPIFITSSHSGEGKSEINNFIALSNIEYAALVGQNQ
jgi:GTP-binding protein